MDMTEINRLYSMIASGDEEMQNLGIRTMMPKLKIPHDEEGKKKIVDMLKSNLCIQAFDIGQEEGREIQKKITGKWQPIYRNLKMR